VAEAVRDVIRFYSRQAKAGRNEPDFFELVRRVENAVGRRDVGKSVARREEPVRFGQLPHLNYADSAVAEIVDRAIPSVFVNFFGLWGPQGPMPLALTGFVYQRMHNCGDNSPRRFADILNHRFLGLYYRAWKANEQAALFDKSDGGLVAKISTALAGEVCRGTLLGPLESAHDSGIFGLAGKSRDGLRTLLRRAFDVTVDVRTDVESRGTIPAEDRFRLGRCGVSELGVSTQLGSQYSSRTRKFAVEIGPLDFARAAAFLPGSPDYDRLVAYVQCYLDRPLAWDLRLAIVVRSLPAATLDGTRQLGRTVWLGRPCETVLTLVIGASRLAAAARRRATDSLFSPDRKD